MAFCPTAPNPPHVVEQTLISPINPPNSGQQAGAWGTIGQNEKFRGDFAIAGAGTRNFGKGTIMLSGIPDDTQILSSYLIYNTYESNNQVDPPPVTIQSGNGPIVGSLPTTLHGICNSTCWFNPPGGFTEPTTYLRNRIYVTSDIKTIVKGNGVYKIDGLPVDVAMPIGADGTRIPGCKCSQGAVLLVVWAWNDEADILNPATFRKNLEARPRAINAYLGAALIDNNPGLWGGAIKYTLPFAPVKSDVDGQYFKGNANVGAAAGDAQQTVDGDTFAINQIRFLPPNNAWTRTAAPSLSVKKMGLAQVYDENTAYSSTSLDCIDWFLFVISGDKTQPKAQMQIVNCAATFLIGRGVGECDPEYEDVRPNDVAILVASNFVETSQTKKDGKCRAVAYTGTEQPKPNAPGMFPDAPFYIKIDDEIMKVIEKCPGVQSTSGATPTVNGGKVNDPILWKVLRGQNGTTPAKHLRTVGPNPFISGDNTSVTTCVYYVKPPKAISDMASGLVPTGQPAQRPSPGRPIGRRRR